MKRTSAAILFISFLFISFSALSFAQDDNQTSAPETQAVPAGVEPSAGKPGFKAPEVAEPAPAPAESPKSTVSAKIAPAEWLYGEVGSVDIAGRSLILTYLDYDTDIEKQATVYTDDKTIFENAKALEDVKPQDMLSIDYNVTPDGKNLAVSISVEKPESVEELNMPAQNPPPAGQGIKPAVEMPANPPAQETPSVNDNSSEQQPVKAE